MISVEIKNWKDFREHFGVKKSEQHLNAIELGIKLRELINKFGVEDNFEGVMNKVACVYYNSEGMATFDVEEISPDYVFSPNVKQGIIKVYFTGTAG